jgi:hypothetical protein
MKNNKYHTVGTVLKSNLKIVATVAKSIPSTHTYVYMTIHFVDLAHTLE